jgi:putative ABC transport system substrate-binding protein
VAASDPVEAGLVDSLARPRGNVTGLTRFTTELSGKQLELLKEAFPRISLVAVLWNPEVPGPSLAFKETQAAAKPLDVQLQLLEVRGSNDLDKAFAAIVRKRAGALMVLGDTVTILLRARTSPAGFASRNRQ